MRQTRKQAFDASDLIPIMCEEVLPGDTWQHTENILARLATPIAPLVDDMDLETFYFFVPNRITDPDWEDLITGADTDATIPTIAPYNGATFTLAPGSVLDHFGLLPQTYTSAFRVNVYPIWAYFTIWNEWFRDQNLQAEYTWTWTPTGSTQTITNGTSWDQMPHGVIKKGGRNTVTRRTRSPAYFEAPLHFR